MKNLGKYGFIYLIIHLVVYLFILHMLYFYFSYLDIILKL